MADLVNHPPHYTEHPSGVECIQIVEHMGFCLGNAIKYIWRADLKGAAALGAEATDQEIRGAAIEDLRKAVWYINREIERRVAAGNAQRDQEGARRAGVSENHEPEAGVSGEGDDVLRRESCHLCGNGVSKCSGYCG